MAKSTLIFPFAGLKGKLRKNDGVYMRMLHGKCIVQSTPRMQSTKRIAACQAFGERYGTAHRKSQPLEPLEPPLLLPLGAPTEH